MPHRNQPSPGTMPVVGVRGPLPPSDAFARGVRGPPPPSTGGGGPLTPLPGQPTRRNHPEIPARALFLAVRAPEPDPFLPWWPLLAPLDQRPAASARPPRPPIHPALPPGPGIPSRDVPGPCLVGV